MEERQAISRRMREHYESVWSAADPWDFESSGFDAQRFAAQLALVSDRRYPRVLDLGCGSGAFAHLLGDISERVLGLDIAAAAVTRAQARCADRPNIEFRAADMMAFDVRARGPWDLIVMSESIYCLGWLYPLFDVGWFVSELLDALADRGRFLLVNTLGKETDYLLLPWLVKTYRDLFLNVGYLIETERALSGEKHGVEFDVSMTLFRKPA